MDTPFTHVITLDMTDVDFTGRWQAGAIFRAMQDASSGHTEVLGCSYETLNSQGLAWVLTRAHLHMDEYPVFGQTVTIETWPGKTRHMFFPRNYRFVVDGRVVGAALSVFVMLDIQTRTIAPATRLQTPVPAFDIPAPLPFPGNVQALEGAPADTAYAPVYTDIDMNGHANNTRYVDWFMNRFPCAWHENHVATDLLIHYHHEILPTDALTLSLRTQEDVSVMQGMREDTCCFAVEGRFRAI